MRIIGVIPSEKQVGGLIDSLKNIGLDRKDIIVSDMNKTRARHSALDDVYIKTETDSLNDLSALAGHFENVTDRGILVAVEVPQRDSSRIREIMEQNGATKILQD